MTGRFKVPIWIVPLMIAALVAGFGWWGNVRLRDTIEEELKAQLTATLDANVTALDIWTTNQMKLASVLAGETTVRNLGAKILERATNNGGRLQFPGAETRQLANYLRPRLNMMGYEIAQLVS